MCVCVLKKKTLELKLEPSHLSKLCKCKRDVPLDMACVFKWGDIYEFNPLVIAEKASVEKTVSSSSSSTITPEQEEDTSKFQEWEIFASLKIF